MVICEEDSDGTYFDELVSSGNYDRVEYGKFSCKYDKNGIERDDEFDIKKLWER